MVKSKNLISAFVIIAVVTAGIAMMPMTSAYAAGSVNVTAPKSVKAKAGTGRIKVSWEKAEGADGYYIYMAKAKKNGKAGKYRRAHTVKVDKAKCTVRFVDKGKYYIKVKAYKHANGKTYKSVFSKRAKAAVKKESVYYICTCGKKFGSEAAVEKHQKHYRDLFMEFKMSLEEMNRHAGWRSSTWDDGR
jgi:hypothetical protein